MGVPKFYRWLSERYPQINQMISGTNILPEFDNFYLDMNGIIHACTHPNDNPLANSLTMRDMVLGIFRYIDRMVTEIVRPKKILFLAIDGVAPRAKLNQQRARRFRAAQERMESITKALEKGEEVDEEAMFDSNCITPGTDFMEQVGAHLRWFIRKKIKDDPLWRSLRIVFSGHDVPGEGEHKIMQFIRELRADPHYEPNQRHCMYGQDADLIMLGLASHEPHFALLREVIDFGSFKGGGSAKGTVIRQTRDVQFQLLHLSVLREYISLDFAYGCTAWVPNQERLMDDFIFLTFLVGNDFLPHLPTLDIGEHAFDVLISAYRQLMQESEGYLVEDGEIRDIVRFEKLCAIVGQQEQNILENRAEEVRKAAGKKSRFGPPKRSQEELDDDEEEAQRAFELALQEALGSAGAGAAGQDDCGAAGESKRSDAVDMDCGDETSGEWGAVGSTGRRPAPKKSGRKDGDGSDGGLIVNKDFRGRYYFEKFKIIASQQNGRDFLSKLMREYLQGLMWCLAYYIKGCVSWTWYYPYHYGPMLQDMQQLKRYTGGPGAVRFSLGAPFLPYQQLLGCLPPASARLLPRPYQWLMISDDSPVKEFYPEDFDIDQDGKKNPWEAVVLLDFIDEKRLLKAEALHCPASKLSSAERRRNVFGTVSTVTFDPAVWESYPAPPPLTVRAGVNITAGNLGLVDIPVCQSSAQEEAFSLQPGKPFRAELVPGTTYPIAGFPSLTTLPVQGFESEFAKINVFGSDSRYRSLIIKLKSPNVTEVETLNAELLLGRAVYVNYPQTHEAKVVAVTTEKGEHRLVPAPDNGSGAMVVRKTVFDRENAAKWKREAEEEQQKYLKGRGVPGSGGLDIGPVLLRLRVCPLQGLKRDPATGETKKVYSDSIEEAADLQRSAEAAASVRQGAASGVGGRGMEADVPVQMAVWTPPVEDLRFEESAALTVEQLLPYGSEVVSLAGPLLGCKGIITGPHGPDSASDKKKQNPKKLLQSSASSIPLVDVEFSVPLQPEAPFGYSIAAAVTTEYFSSKDLCQSLQISPSVLGKVVGSIRVEPGRLDLGLNLRRNGQYQLVGYARNVSSGAHGSGSSCGSTAAGTVAGRRAWQGTGSTMVTVVGGTGEGADAAAQAQANAAAESEGSYWEYSAQAAALIFDYKMNFPQLFMNLERLPHSAAYAAEQLLLPVPEEHVTPATAALGMTGKAMKESERLMEWLQAQPFFKMHRSLLSSAQLPKEAMTAIEKAGDILSGKAAVDSGRPVPTDAERFKKVVVKGIPSDKVYSAMHRGAADVPLPYNVLEPKLGDRVINLSTPGVPFALRGTVVAIHSNTQFVEVIYDEEFLAGRALQGNCSQFRGKLCPWTSLLLISRSDEYLQFKKNSKGKMSGLQKGGKGGKDASGPNAAAAVAAVGRDGHIKGQFPVPTAVQLKVKQRQQVTSNSGNVASTVSILKPNRSVGPAVTVATVAAPVTKYVHVDKVPALEVVASDTKDKEFGGKKKEIGAAGAATVTSVTASEKASMLKFALQQRHAVNTIMSSTAAATAVDGSLGQQLDHSVPYSEESSINLLLPSGQTGAPRTSDGSGFRALLAAAAADSSDEPQLLPPQHTELSHNPLLGVVSMDSAQYLQRGTTGAAQPPPPPPSATTEATRTTTVDKAASLRILKHELSKNHSKGKGRDGSRASAAVGDTEPAKPKSWAALAAKPGGPDSAVTAPDGSRGGQYGKKVSVTAILANPSHAKQIPAKEGAATAEGVKSVTAKLAAASLSDSGAPATEQAKAPLTLLEKLALAAKAGPTPKAHPIVDKDIKTKDMVKAKDAGPKKKKQLDGLEVATAGAAAGASSWTDITTPAAAAEPTPAVVTAQATDGEKPKPKKQSAAALLKNAKKAMADKKASLGSESPARASEIASVSSPEPIISILKKATKIPAEKDTLAAGEKSIVTILKKAPKIPAERSSSPKSAACPTKAKAAASPAPIAAKNVSPTKVAEIKSVLNKATQRKDGATKVPVPAALPMPSAAEVAVAQKKPSSIVPSRVLLTKKQAASAVSASANN